MWAQGLLLACCCCLLLLLLLLLLKRVAHPWTLKGGVKPRQGKPSSVTAIFSVMPLFKNFNFPPRKNISLPLLSLGALYVSVFSSVLHVVCVAGRFSVFVFPKCRLLLGTGKGKRPVKRGKGQDGQKARYATQMTLAARAAQYPHEPFTVKQTDAGEQLWCLCCGKPVSHQTKTYVGDKV